MSRAVCDVEFNGFAATRARRFARDTVKAWRLLDVALEVEMVATELVTNAVLHGAPPVSLELAHDGDVLRVAVKDGSAAVPVVVRAAADAMTGRGLALVGSLSAQWGVVPAGGGRAGKLVWAELVMPEVQADLPRPRGETALTRTAVSVTADVNVSGSDEGVVVALPGVNKPPTRHLELVFEGWDDAPLPTEDASVRLVLTDVPTRLLLAVETYVDNVVRELTLASYETVPPPGRRPDDLYGPLVDTLRDAVAAFGDVRRSVKRQAIAAAVKGEERVDLTVVVPTGTAGVAERYLAALNELDEFAHAERLLTAESPHEHRIFRRWYVDCLIGQMRAHADGVPPEPHVPFEQFLLEEVARLSVAERGSDRARRLHRAAAVVAAAPTVAEVAKAVVAECVGEARAVTGVLMLRDDSGDIVTADNPDRADVDSTDMDLTDAAVLAREVLATVAPAWREAPDGSTAWYAVPLVAGTDVVGALVLGFARRRALDSDELLFVQAVSAVAAQATMRLRLERRQAESNARLALLAEASRQLATSLDYGQALQTVVDLAVPQLADWCGVTVVDEGELVTAAIGHADPAKVAYARRLLDLYPQTLTQSRAVRAVLRSGTPLLLHGVDDKMLGAEAVDERHMRMLRDLGLATVLIVPLQSKQRVVGVLSLARADRGFDAADTTLAEEIGRRAGVAVETARLVHEVRESRQTAAGTSHTRLALALSAASMGSFEWELGADVISLDARMRDIGGISQSELVGVSRLIKELVHPDDQLMVEAVIERAVSRLDDISMEFRVRRADGRVCWVDCRGRVLPGDDGKAARVIGVAFDSTELREARDRVARTLEHMGDAFFSLDPSWRVTYMNAAAERMLGRDRASLVGRTLWAQFPGAVGGLFDHECRIALESRRPIAFERFIEATGRHFEVRVQPIPEGLGVYFNDVTEIRRFEREQAKLRAVSQHARSEAEAARRKLSFIADTAADMMTTLDPGEVCRRLALHSIDRLANWVSVYLLDGDHLVRVASAHSDPAWKAAVAQLVHAFPVDVSSRARVARVVRTRQPIVEPQITESMYVDTFPDPEARALVNGIGMSSLLIVPMVARGEALGAIAFVRSEPVNPFDSEDVRLAVTLASRSALVVQNAQLYSRQTSVVEALQQAVLPERLPSIPGIELSARYEPARGGAGVGGDFYDVFHLPSGRVALAVGDAAGHGVRAGALMGQLRNALRAYAFQERGPLLTLRSLSELIGGLEPDAFATAFYAEFDPVTGEFSWANAGHPPPLLAVPGEMSRYLDGPTSPPLGIFADFEVSGDSVVVPPGGGVLIYTDGLIERRHRDISDCLAALQVLVDAEPFSPGCIDAVVDGMRGGSGFVDDVCVLSALRSRDL